ncbi:MAG: MBOAT family protein [Clostridia bacterium]|nr:MBOAT family protein [Clostridia bacterium]
MSITSFTFLLFIGAVLLAYFLVPKRCQWVVLLIASCCFYLSYGVRYFLFVLFTSASVYAAVRAMQKMADGQKAFLKGEGKELGREEKNAYKAKVKSRKKAVMLCAMLANLLVLCVFKYAHFVLEQVQSVIVLFGGAGFQDILKLAAPLGISFYTFQMVGYLLDVYWGNVEAEKNYFKTLLFCSFFPQMTQGPISEFGSLGEQLFGEHAFSYKNYSWGMQRMCWGFFKKMVVADALAPLVQDVYANYPQYAGVTVLFGVFMYSVQIYADFSGYMDIMCGLCEVMGIRLTENFDRPYFSKSVAEYWRRWHMSLGAWFKRFIYYPIGISKWNRELGKKSREKLGRKFGDMLPASIALVVVWLATGLWHGASWAYIVWGLVNGLFIILNLWLDPVYAACRRKLGIRENAWLWRAFQVIRTFILVSFIKILPEVGTLGQGLGLWARVFTNHDIPGGVRQLLPFLNWTSTFTLVHFVMAVLGTGCMFAVSLLQRRRQVRAYTEKWPMILRVVMLCVLFFFIITFGIQNTWEGGGFLYAQF